MKFGVFHKTIRHEVDVLDFQPPTVLLESRQPLPLGDCDVHAMVAGVRMKASVRVLESEGKTARAHWLSPQEALPYLSQLFPPEKRRSPRYSQTLRVKSPLGFQGWTIDISSCGVRFETQAGLDLNQRVPIQLELSDAFETRLELQAGVRWFAPSLTEGWTVAGLEFEGINPDTPEHQRYHKFLDRLACQPNTVSA